MDRFPQSLAIPWLFFISESLFSPRQNRLRDPVSVLRELDTHQWLMFTVGFLGWTWDAFDFFTVSLTVTEIATDFGKSEAAVSWVCKREMAIN